MNIDTYDYFLPKELIAQQPSLIRDKCRLMVLDKTKKTVNHKQFHNIIEYLDEGDVLVLNNTKVMHARLTGKKEGSGGKIEILLVNKTESKNEVWRVLLNKKKGLKSGTKIIINKNLYANVLLMEDNEYLLQFYNDTSEKFESIIDKIGNAPLPPYIKRDYTDINTLNNDKIYYQTIYAKENGSIASPTAGLHFTQELLTRIRGKGIKMAEITLKIGKGTFIPIKTDIVEEHKMGKEYLEINEYAAKIITEAKKSGKRIISIGTTATRALETAGIKEDSKESVINPLKCWTNLFIYDNFKFKVIDGLVTNFHLPKSTNLVLTCTFGGKEFIIDAYKEAVREGYKFYSYGDAMMIL